MPMLLYREHSAACLWCQTRFGGSNGLRASSILLSLLLAVLQGSGYVHRVLVTDRFHFG